jgi:hypothetical protein
LPKLQNGRFHALAAGRPFDLEAHISAACTSISPSPGRFLPHTRPQQEATIGGRARVKGKPAAAIDRFNSLRVQTVS